LDPAISPRDVIRRFALGSGLSILIKVANSILAYAMLLIIARVSTAEQYGIFAVAFSIGISLSLCATLGQPTLITRFWPQWMGQEETGKAHSVLRFSLRVTALGIAIAAAVLLLGGALKFALEVPWTFGIAAGTALFTFAFGWAEYVSAALRAQGYIALALAPRDIVWRIAICAIFGWAMLAGLTFRADAITLIVGGALLLIIAPQILLLIRSLAGQAVHPLPGPDRRETFRYSAIMWTASTFQLARAHGGTVIVSAYLGAETAGAYFAADRTANLLTFLLLAVNLVSAPLISRYYHSGRTDLVRLIVGLSGLVAGFAALAGVVVFFVLGETILGFFNPAYAAYLPVLLTLCVGQFLMAASGPAGNLLTQTGHERMLLILIVSGGVVSLASQAIAGLYWGAIGVAAGAAVGPVIVNVFAVIYTWRALGIDSTGLSLVARACRNLGRGTSRESGKD
jgi:O-antigen/teichoic acid export membrane protein